MLNSGQKNQDTCRRNSRQKEQDIVKEGQIPKASQNEVKDINAGREKERNM